MTEGSELLHIGPPKYRQRRTEGTRWGKTIKQNIDATVRSCQGHNKLLQKLSYIYIYNVLIITL